MPFGLLAGFGAAFAWGTLDIITALTSRVIGSLRVTTGLQIVSAVEFTALAVLTGAAIPARPGLDRGRRPARRDRRRRLPLVFHRPADRPDLGGQRRRGRLRRAHGRPLRRAARRDAHDRPGARRVHRDRRGDPDRPRVRRQPARHAVRRSRRDLRGRGARPVRGDVDRHRHRARDHRLASAAGAWRGSSTRRCRSRILVVLARAGGRAATPSDGAPAWSTRQGRGGHRRRGHARCPGPHLVRDRTRDGTDLDGRAGLVVRPGRHDRRGRRVPRRAPQARSSGSALPASSSGWSRSACPSAPVQSSAGGSGGSGAWPLSGKARIRRRRSRCSSTRSASSSTEAIRASRWACVPTVRSQTS